MIRLAIYIKYAHAYTHTHTHTHAYTHKHTHIHNTHIQKTLKKGKIRFTSSCKIRENHIFVSDFELIFV